MIIKTKKVFYCEFCKKHSLRSLEDHEKYCTANQHRQCRLCNTKSIENLIEKYKKINVETIDGIIKFEKEPNELIKLILNDVKFCPNCCLTILRIVFGKNGKNVMWCFEYHYKDELEKWWKEKNKEIEYY